METYIIFNIVTDLCHDVWAYFRGEDAKTRKYRAIIVTLSRFRVATFRPAMQNPASVVSYQQLVVSREKVKRNVVSLCGGVPSGMQSYDTFKFFQIFMFSPGAEKIKGHDKLKKKKT